MLRTPQNTTIEILSVSVAAYRRNFGKLYLIFALSILVLLLPVMFNLGTCITQISRTVYNLDSTPLYTAVYIIRPLLENGVLIYILGTIWAIGVLTTPLCMGMACRIAMEDTEGRKCGLGDAFRWTLRSYKRLLSAYVFYYIVFTAFGIAFLALMYWMLGYASHIVSETWLYPSIALFAFGSVALLLGTVYLPFAVLEDQKSSIRAYGYSFRIMYSRHFPHHFPKLVFAAVLAGIIAFAAFLPVTFPLLTGTQADVLMFFMTYNNDMALMVAFVFIIAFVGVFLFLFAYNTYRSKDMAAARRETEERTYRRKIETVRPAYRRRIG